jgi:hypothetical protein
VCIKHLLPQSPLSLHDNLNREIYQISKTVQNTDDQLSDTISSNFIDSMSHDVDTEASNGTATGCPTISVRLQNQTAISESGQQQGVQTAAGNPTEKLDSVSREVDKEYDPEEDVSNVRF